MFVVVRVEKLASPIFPPSPQRTFNSSVGIIPQNPVPPSFPASASPARSPVSPEPASPGNAYADLQPAFLSARSGSQRAFSDVPADILQPPFLSLFHPESTPELRWQ